MTILPTKQQTDLANARYEGWNDGFAQGRAEATREIIAWIYDQVGFGLDIATLIKLAEGLEAGDHLRPADGDEK